MKVVLFLVCTFCCFLESKGQIFDDAIVHEIRIISTNTNLWSQLSEDYDSLQSNGTKTYQKVDVIIDGDTVSSVGLRWKGEYSNKGFPGIKKPLKIDFNEFIDDQEFQGITKVNLANFALDPSFLREKISYELHEKMGNVVPKTSYGNVFLNEQRIGLYLLVEQIDKRFLKKQFAYPKGNLYKCVDGTELKYIDQDFESYHEDFELRTNEDSESHENFIGFVENLFKADYFNTKPKLQEFFNLDAYLNVLSVDVFLNNWDSYYGNGRNFYLYDDPLSGKLVWLPWDYNLAFSPSKAYIFPRDNSQDHFKPLIRKIYDNECTRNHYMDHVCELLQKLDRPYWYHRVANLKTLIADAVIADTNKFYATELFFENIYGPVVVEKLNLNAEFLKMETLPGITQLFDYRPNELQSNLFHEDFECGGDYCESCIDIRAYPNPNQGVFQVEITTNESSLSHFRITTIDGRSVFSHSFNNDYQHFIWKQFVLPQGLYLLSVTTSSKKTKTARVLIH